MGRDGSAPPRTPRQRQAPSARRSREPGPPPSLHHRFFPAVSHLATARVPLAVLANAGLAALLLAYKATTAVRRGEGRGRRGWGSGDRADPPQIFLGALRDAEIERVHERLAGAAMETALAMAVFRADATPSAAVRFALLAAAKVLHWLAADRVSHLESAADPRPADGVRLAGLLTLLLALDSAATGAALDAALARPDGVHALFAFECVVLASGAASTVVKAALAAADRALGGRWDGKGVAVMYVDLTTDLVHLLGK